MDADYHRKWVNIARRFTGHAREWLAGFVQWYNTEHLHSAIGHVTPKQLRTGEAKQIFERRNIVMEQARKSSPERWGRRNMKVWGSPQMVVLNPQKKS
ncbi:integrase core domain-containing protein [Trichlorobacter lovleyi]|uniref:integrase core domain-containing protein n=1 Tax=Trichlorobacter lovleyi TaxID=313985 RepID=UPI001427B989|nr:integrase core domain-containing protein [Trichlorobacter lovleyi]